VEIDKSIAVKENWEKWTDEIRGAGSPSYDTARIEAFTSYLNLITKTCEQDCLYKIYEQILMINNNCFDLIHVSRYYNFN